MVSICICSSSNTSFESRNFDSSIFSAAAFAVAEQTLLHTPRRNMSPWRKWRCKLSQRGQLGKAGEARETSNRNRNSSEHAKAVQTWLSASLGCASTLRDSASSSSSSAVRASNCNFISVRWHFIPFLASPPCLQSPFRLFSLFSFIFKK